MALDVDPRPTLAEDPKLNPEFANRLEQSLERADQTLARRQWLGRIRTAAFVLILVTPILFWNLGGATHDGLGTSINLVAWLAFLLDVGVHINSGLLAYLGLRALPIAVGALIFVLVTVTLLGKSEET